LFTRYKFTNEEKKAYINGELCLMRIPGVTGLPGTKSRWDDMAAVHQTQTDHIHLTAYFLPFHRLMLHAHEHALRQDCGYRGDLPYWDETVDAGRFLSADIFDSDKAHGFGGNSGRETGCVEDGAFRHMSMFSILHALISYIKMLANLSLLL
jgi:tyrosinase